MNQDPTAPFDPSRQAEVQKEFVQDAVADATAKNRAQAAAILAGMPAWWRDRFVAIGRTNGIPRSRMRRMTNSLLRRYATWTRATDDKRRLQAKEKEKRHADLRARIQKRAARGITKPISGMSAVDHERFSSPAVEVLTPPETVLDGLST